jgi:epoxyqueuosine reductase QueG
VSALLDDLRGRAAAAGLNLFGVVDTERFDRCQPAEARCSRVLPGCDTAVVIGSGGGHFWQQLLAVRGLPPRPTLWRRPLQQFAAAALHPLRAQLEAAGHDVHLAPAMRARVNIARLAEAAGFGIVSPVVHVLLHPRFGPWVCVRAVLLLRGRPFGAIADSSVVDSFQPCATCSRPCVSACPAGVHDGFGNSDFERCAAHRRDGGCESGCHVRRACPVGATERYDPVAEAHCQREETLNLEQRYGFGVWRLLQRLLCR